MISRRRFNQIAPGFLGASIATSVKAQLPCSSEDLSLVEAEDRLIFNDFLLEELGLTGAEPLSGGKYGPQKTAGGGISLNSLSALAEVESTSDDRSFLDFSETRDYALSARFIEDFLSGAPSYGEIDATFEWPSFERSMDTHHLHLQRFGEPDVGAAFDISPLLLERLAASNHFDLDYHFDATPNSRPTLFVLRGCTLRESFDPATPWRERIPAAYAPPVHASIRATPGAAHGLSFYNRRGCVLGAWDRSSGKVVAVEANSLPTQDFARRKIKDDNGDTLMCSVLPTGFYRYVFGKMGNGKQAFRKERHDYIVLRSPFDVDFDPFDIADENGKLTNTSVWTTGRYHHIHNTLAGTGYGAGCTIVSFEDGSWEGFLSALRMLDELRDLPRKYDSTPYVDARGRAFQFYGMVLSGAEAALMAQGGADFAAQYKRLRTGSGGKRYGDVVRAFQSRAPLDARRLGVSAKIFDSLSVDGKFGRSAGIAALILNRLLLLENGEPLADHSAPIVVLS